MTFMFSIVYVSAERCKSFGCMVEMKPIFLLLRFTRMALRQIQETASAAMARHCNRTLVLVFCHKEAFFVGS